MKIQEILNKTESELKDMIVSLKKEKLNLKFQRVNGQLTNPARFKIARRDVARIKTVLNNQTKKS